MLRRRLVWLLALPLATPDETYHLVFAPGLAPRPSGEFNLCFHVDGVDDDGGDADADADGDDGDGDAFVALELERAADERCRRRRRRAA